MKTNGKTKEIAIQMCQDECGDHTALLPNGWRAIVEPTEDGWRAKAVQPGGGAALEIKEPYSRRDHAARGLSRAIASFGLPVTLR